MSVIVLLKQGLKSAFYGLGVLGLWHRWRNRHLLTVLMFHRVLPADSLAYQLAEKEFTFTTMGFEKCLKFVRRHYNVVNLQDVYAAVKSGTRLPPNPVLITFDDGWRDTVLHAEPLLRKHKMTAVLFLSTEVPDLKGARWWQDAMVAVMANARSRQRLRDEFRKINSDVPSADTVEADRLLTAQLASLPERERLDLLDLAQPGVVGAITERQMLTQCDLRRLAGGPIALGGHGHTHAPLTHAVDSRTELKISLERIEAVWTGPLSMSFPHGAMNEELIRQAHESGFELVFSSEPTVSVLSKAAHSSLGRIHVPENRWTCRDGRIDGAQLATFLFFRSPTSSVSIGNAA